MQLLNRQVTHHDLFSNILFVPNPFTFINSPLIIKKNIVIRSFLVRVNLHSRVVSYCNRWYDYLVSFTLITVILKFRIRFRWAIDHMQKWKIINEDLPHAKFSLFPFFVEPVVRTKIETHWWDNTRFLKIFNSVELAVCI